MVTHTGSVLSVPEKEDGPSLGLEYICSYIERYVFIHNSTFIIEGTLGLRNQYSFNSLEMSDLCLMVFE
jgi:hypothetical protein